LNGVRRNLQHRQVRDEEDPEEDAEDDQRRGQPVGRALDGLRRTINGGTRSTAKIFRRCERRGLRAGRQRGLECPGNELAAVGAGRETPQNLHPLSACRTFHYHRRPPVSWCESSAAIGHSIRPQCTQLCNLNDEKSPANGEPGPLRFVSLLSPHRSKERVRA
jgi:hypothetical protein